MHRTIDPQQTTSPKLVRTPTGWLTTVGLVCVLGVLAAASAGGLLPIQLETAEAGRLVDDWPIQTQQELSVRLAAVERPTESPVQEIALVASESLPQSRQPLPANDMPTRPTRQAHVGTASRSVSPADSDMQNLAQTEGNALPNLGTWQSRPEIDVVRRPEAVRSVATSAASQEKQPLPSRAFPGSADALPPRRDLKTDAKGQAVAALKKQSLRVPSTLRVTDLAGEPVSLVPVHSERGVVVVCLAADCPLSRGYLPDLTRLAATWNALGVRFCGVFVDPQTQRNEMLSIRHEEHVRFPLAADRSQSVATLLQPTRTPEVFVIGRDGRVVYRGRIDDRFHDDPRQRQFSRDFLSDALEAVVYGRSLGISRTAAIGRLLP